MKCPECGTDGTLFATVKLEVTAALVKGGGISMAGVTVTQATVKDAWKAADVRSPIECAACGTDFHYVVGAKNALRKGPPPEGEQPELPFTSSDDEGDSDETENEGEEE